MLSFFEDIANMTGFPLEILKDGYQIFNFCGKSVYIANYKNIMTYNDQQIVLKLKKGVVRINGEGLYIKELNLSTIIINGTIVNIEVS